MFFLRHITFVLIVTFTPLVEGKPLKDLYSLPIEQLTVASIQKRIERTFSGKDVVTVPLKYLYFLDSTNYSDLNKNFSLNYPNKELNAILISNGHYDIETVTRLINNPAVIKKINERTYLLRAPIVISPSASLLIENISLRLSVRDSASVFYFGHLNISSSELLSWDAKSNQFAQRKEIKDESLLLYGDQEVRPFILGLSGSEGWFVNSLFKGLGYKGKASFGISITSTKINSKSLIKGLKRIINSLPKSRAIIIGNTIEDCFFGYYSNRSSSVRLIGNLFQNNMVYNIEPHDYSSDLVIARNVTLNAKKAHGIILSREVSHSLIIENLTLFNKGTGIMIDRNSNDNQIKDNVSFANSGDGIAIFESDGNKISNNFAYANGNDGIYIRNSDDILLMENKSQSNASNGLTTAVADIDFLETRNFKLDTYHKSSKTHVVKNVFSYNVNSAISSKNNAEIFIHKNNFTHSGHQIFSGQLKKNSLEILIANQKNGYLHPKLKEVKQ